MHPKAISATTSSKSITNKSGPSGPTGIETPVQFVKGVGPRLGAIFNSRDIRTVRDLLHFFPRAYEDRRKLLQISELKEGERASVALQVAGSRSIPMRGGKGGFRRTMLEVRCSDASGTMGLKWFHAPRGIETKLSVGAQLIATGIVKQYMNRPEIIHPEIAWGVSSDASEADVGRLIPVYTEIEGVSSRVLRKILWEALERFASYLTEDLPAASLSKHGLPRLATAIRSIHFPDESDGIVEFNTPAHHRLVYEEFFKFEYLVLRQRLKMERALATRLGPSGGREAAQSLESVLPFQLTQGQKVALAEILDDLSLGSPMNRLIQGDVGSGKTAVAFLAAACALAEGCQGALMAPTEILAEQHLKNALTLLGGKLNVELMTGRTPPAERAKILARLSAGEPLLLIGTHALIEEPVVFKNLALIMIDEQHRFGVEQRRTLRNKGRRLDSVTGRICHAHQLVLTATPIPRTLALTAYGDLSVSSIRELPPGRSPVKTEVIVERTARSRALNKIREELKNGRQAYFIYPLVNESEAEGFTQLKSAVAEAERLGREVFPQFKVGLLHGQMRGDQKASVMDQFKRNELHVLVSTTVVEVGVDVPNATIMAIEHSERFGLSQLHQLRGRVGRGQHASQCFLFSHPQAGEATAERLRVLERTQDGFQIAEADLEIRGPGEFLGTRQAGGLPFRLANLVRDRDWLLKARDDAASLLQNDPDLLATEHLCLRRYYEREGNVQFDRLKTS